MCEVILEELQAKKLEPATKTAPEVKNWIEKHESFLCKMLNKQRSYGVSQTKDSAESWWHSHEKTLPTVDQIKACRDRTLDLSVEENMAIAVFYVDSLCASICGHKHTFPEHARIQLPISKASPSNMTSDKEAVRDPEDIYLTVELEALVSLAYDNFRDAWLEIFPVKQLYPKPWKMTPSVKVHEMNQKGMDYTPVESLKRVYLHHDKFKGKWTEADKGAKSEGGWTDVGRNEYIKNVEALREARKSAHCDAWEEAVLKGIQEHRGVKKAPIAKEQPKRKATGAAVGKFDCIAGGGFRKKKKAETASGGATTDSQNGQEAQTQATTDSQNGQEAQNVGQGGASSGGGDGGSSGQVGPGTRAVV